MPHRIFYNIAVRVISSNVRDFMREIRAIVAYWLLCLGEHGRIKSIALRDYAHRWMLAEVKGRSPNQMRRMEAKKGLL